MRRPRPSPVTPSVSSSSRHGLPSGTPGAKDFVLIDVREQVERDINQIPGSILIPKGDFQTGAALA